MSTSFAELDRARGIDPSDRGGQSSLDDWYLSIRETPIEELSDGDVFRSVRQRIYVDHTVPEALKRLIKDPLAGDLYDGQGIVSLADLSAQFWSAHPQESAMLRRTLQDVLNRLDDDVKQDALKLLATLDVKTA